MKRNARLIVPSIFLGLLIAALVPAAPAAALETLATFAADCTTPKTIFQLGDTVCTQVSNVAPGDLNNIYLQLVAAPISADSSTFGSTGTTAVTSDGQTFLHTLATSGEDAGKGRWRAQTRSSIGPQVVRSTKDFFVPRQSVIGVHRDSGTSSVLYFRNSNTTGIGEGTIGFGLPGDIGLVGDWDGDGIYTVGVYRPSEGTFYLANSPVGAVADLVITFGPLGGTPIVGDWDGDGITTIGVHKDDVFHLRNSNTTGPDDVTFQYGLLGDLPVVGDWDGDGVTTVGVFRDGFFYLRNSNTEGMADLSFQYGLPGDLPVAGDWNADGLDTIGILRGDVFHLRNSNDTGVADLIVPFGLIGDKPAITRANESPVVTAGGTLNYTEGQAATNIDAGITVSDMDGVVIVGGTAQITTNCTPGEDVLSFVPVAFIVGSYDSATCKVTFTSNKPVFRYKQAFQNVSYSNTSATPSTLPRTVTWILDDGAVANFLSAPVTSTINVTAKTPQTITFDSAAPGSAVVGGATYNVLATGGASGNPVTFAIDGSATGVCSIVGSTVSFIGAGTCVINANQAGNATFKAAPQVQQSFAVGQGSQTINFTSSPPPQPTVGAPDYPVAANGGPSGNPVTFSTSTPAVCTSSGLNGSSISFVGPGNCLILADQAGNANYAAATQQEQSFQVKNGQTITFTSSPPPEPVVGAPAYPVTATSSALLTPVTFSSATPAVCTSGGPNGSQITFVGTGTCTINANQAGNANTWPAPQAQQSFTVKNAQAISFTSTPPNPALFNGPTYHVTATGGGSGNAVVFTIDGSSTSGCTINNTPVPNSVHFDTDAGTCVINANQAGNGTFAPAPQVQQPFAVAPNPSPDGFNALGNVLVDSSNGPGTPFTVISNDQLPAGTTISAFDATSAKGGAVTMVMSGANMGRFTYNPPVGFPGAASPADPDTDTFTYTVSKNSQSRQATVTFTIPRKKAWFINNNAGACPAAPCDGRLTNPFTDTSLFAAVNGDGAAGHPIDNDGVFVASSATAYSGAITLRNGQRLVGQGINGASTAVRLNVTVQNGQTLPPNNGTAPTLISGTTVITTGQSNFIHGLTIGNGTAMTGLTGSNFTALTFSDNVTINVGGKALDLATGALTANVNGVTSTGGGNNVVLSGITTSVAATLGSGALSGAAGDALSISGQNGSFSYSGSITNSTSRAVSITSKTGGTVTLSGDINPGGANRGILVQNNSSGTNTITFSGGQKKFSVGSGTAVNLATNTGATIDFSNGGLQITGSGAAAGFSATGGGTVTVTTGTNANTISTATGTALNVTTTIGASGLTFTSISANGGTNGIVLSSTGSSGSLSVTGNAGTCDTLADTCTGGTIQSTSGHGISLTTTQSPSFSFMKITNIGLSGIFGTDVTNFTLSNSVIDGVNTAHTANDSNVAFNTNAGGATENNLDGTVSITNNTINNSYQEGISIKSFAGTISSLTITGNSLTSNTSAALSFGSAVAVTANRNNAGANFAAITTGTISGNTITNFPNGAGILVFAGNAAGSAVGANIGSLASPLLINNNTIDGGASEMGTNGIQITVGHQSDGFFTIGASGAGNDISNVKGNGVACSKFGNNGNSGSAASKCVIAFNTIDAHNIANSSGINTGADSGTANTNTPKLYLDVHNNTVSNTTGNGILSTIRNTDGNGVFSIVNNTVNQPIQGTTANGIRVDSGNGGESAGATVCLKISGNTTTGGKNGSGTITAPGIGLRQNNQSGPAGTFNIDGLTPNPSNDAQMEAYVGNIGQNPGSANGTFGADGVSSIDSGATFHAGTCTIP